VAWPSDDIITLSQSTYSCCRRSEDSCRWNRPSRALCSGKSTPVGCTHTHAHTHTHTGAQYAVYKQCENFFEPPKAQTSSA